MTPENSAGIKKIADTALADLANALRDVQTNYPFLRFKGYLECHSLDGRVHVGGTTTLDNSNGVLQLAAGRAVEPSRNYDASYQPIIDALKDYVP